MYILKHSNTKIKKIYVTYTLTVKLCFRQPAVTLMKKVTTRFIVFYFKYTTFFGTQRAVTRY
jgi:hypothetical protein